MKEIIINKKRLRTKKLTVKFLQLIQWAGDCGEESQTYLGHSRWHARAEARREARRDCILNLR